MTDWCSFNSIVHSAPVCWGEDLPLPAGTHSCLHQTFGSDRKNEIPDTGCWNVFSPQTGWTLPEKFIFQEWLRNRAAVSTRGEANSEMFRRKSGLFQLQWLLCFSAWVFFFWKRNSKNLERKPICLQCMKEHDANNTLWKLLGFSHPHNVNKSCSVLW